MTSIAALESAALESFAGTAATERLRSSPGELCAVVAVTTLTSVTWCNGGSSRQVVARLERLGIWPPRLEHRPEPDNPGSER